MSRFILFGSLSLLMGLTACGTSKQSSSIQSSSLSDNKIVDGQTAADQDVAGNGLAESVVLIVVDFKVDGKVVGEALCTGTLIDPRIVLTAAHCTRSEDPKIPQPTAADFLVFSHLLSVEQLQNATTLPAGVDGYRVKDFKTNEAFVSKDASTQDVALLLLAKPVPTRIAKMAPANMNYDSLSSIMAIGYGVSDDRHSTAPEKQGAGTLRYTQFPSGKFGVLSPADVPNNPTLLGMLAFDADTTSICQGDSGGPIMEMVDGKSTNTIVGITEATVAQFTGQEQLDYAAAVKTGSLDPFFAKYPDAETCKGGINLTVDAQQVLPWVTTNMAALLAESTTP